MSWNTLLATWTKEYWRPHLWLALVFARLFWGLSMRIAHYSCHLILSGQLQCVDPEWLLRVISRWLFWDSDLQNQFNFVHFDLNFFLQCSDQKTLVLHNCFFFSGMRLPANSVYCLEARYLGYVQNDYIEHIIHTGRRVALCTIIQTFGFFRLLLFRRRCKLCRLCQLNRI